MILEPSGPNSMPKKSAYSVSFLMITLCLANSYAHSSDVATCILSLWQFSYQKPRNVCAVFISKFGFLITTTPLSFINSVVCYFKANMQNNTYGNGDQSTDNKLLVISSNIYTCSLFLGLAFTSQPSSSFNNISQCPRVWRAS